MESALKESQTEVKELRKEVNDLKEANAKKDAMNAGMKDQFKRVVQAIVETAEDTDGNFQKNLKDKLVDLM